MFNFGQYRRLEKTARQEDTRTGQNDFYSIAMSQFNEIVQLEWEKPIFPVPLLDSPGESTQTYRYETESETYNTGATSVVHATRYTGENVRESVACKFVNWEALGTTGGGEALTKRKNRLLVEIKALKDLGARHPSVTSILDVSATLSPTHCRIVYPWHGGSLKTHLLQIEGQKIAQPQVVLGVFLKLFDAVAFMHSNGWCHRDIKPENICVILYPGEEWYRSHPVLIDFDYAVRTSPSNSGLRKLTGAVGSAGFIPPEMFTETQYDGKAGDMWSCGMTLLETVFGLSFFQESVIDNGPFSRSAMNDMDIFKGRTNRMIRVVRDACQELMASAGELAGWQEICGYLRRLLLISPGRRPTSSEMVAQALIDIRLCTQCFKDNLGSDHHDNVCGLTRIDSAEQTKRGREEQNLFDADLVLTSHFKGMFESVDCGLAELHVHLDGSLRPETFLELYSQKVKSGEGNLYTFESTDDVEKHLAFKIGWDLPRCLQSFATTLLVLQDKDALERVAYEICEDLYLKSNVTYAEVRYCPSLHRQEGLGDDDIIDAVCRGLSRAMESYPQCSFYQIVTILRDFGAEEAMVMAKLACKHGLDKLVVGVDLAGNEYDHPPEKFIEAFDFVYANGLGITIHAGEGKSEQAEKNIVTAVERLHATRIGHGVAARASGSLQSTLSAKNIAIEICPCSNVHTGSISSISDHPARAFFDAGITIVPCCDNSLLSQTTTRGEYQALAKACNFTNVELKTVAEKSHSAGFGPTKGNWETFQDKSI